MSGNGAKSLSEAMRTLNLGACRAGLSKTAPIHPIITSSRCLATEAPLPTDSQSRPFRTATTVPVTIHTFPSLEPISSTEFSLKQLYLPFRRDLLHRAIVYEGDNTRQGTASSKTRHEVHGSHRKMRPQKGTGHARVGSKQSPLWRGGGKAFGPHPRDFGTFMPRKMYDKAWRTALSWRYRRGELIVCQDGMELPLSEDFYRLAEADFIKGELRDGYMRKQAKQLAAAHGWGKEDGRTLFVTTSKRDALFEAMANASDDGRALELSDVDVKDLLETGRVVMERAALQEMIEAHQSDIVFKIAMVRGDLPARIGPAAMSEAETATTTEAESEVATTTTEPKETAT